MKKFLLVLSSFFLLSACVGGGAEGELYFQEAIYPVSASHGTFLDEKGTLAKESDYEVVGKFKASYTNTALLWGIASLENRTELGSEVNQQVEKAGGHAIKNVKVKVDTSVINLVPVFSLLPFWPSMSVGEVTGDIIRYKHLK